MFDRVQVSDKIFKPYLSQEQILAEVDKVAAKINEDLADKNPMFLCTLNGAFVFAADLYRRFNYKSQITFMRLKSYMGTETTGKVNILYNLYESVEGRTVVVIEDIVESGYTLQALKEKLKGLGAVDVRVAVLLRKPNAIKVKDLHIDYCCFEIPDDFIVGYGLDYNEEGRNLPDIYVVETPLTSPVEEAL